MCIIGDNCRQLYEYGWLIFAVKSVIDRKSLSNDQGLAFLYIFFLLPSVSGRLMYPLLTKIQESVIFLIFFFFPFQMRKKLPRIFSTFSVKLLFFPFRSGKCLFLYKLKKKKKLASKNFTFFFFYFKYLMFFSPFCVSNLGSGFCWFSFLYKWKSSVDLMSINSIKVL